MSLCFDFLKRAAAGCALILPLAVLTGCSNMVSTGGGGNTVDQAAVISGVVHGGRQPISGATVTLWAAGNTGYGSAATSLAVTSTDANGNFAFHPLGGSASYSCPLFTSTTASQLIYITSVGGQPTTGVSNGAAALMAALGDCSTVLATNPTVVVNEVTTVASMFALQQFFTPGPSGTGSFGTSSTNVAGLKNAFATVNNLVTISSGSANASSTATGAVSGYTTAPTVTITPEQSKINTLANVLAACVNTNGATTAGNDCGTLFSSISSATVHDTLQAAYYLASNPTSTVSSTSNLGAVFNTAVANSPFQPSLGTAPTDWTIGVTYGSTSAQTVAATPVYLITEPEYLAVDSNNNVWIANFKTTSVTTAGNSISEFSPVGVPLAQAFTAVGQVATPRNLIIDPTNNVWVASFGSTTTPLKQISEYTAGGVTNSYATTLGGAEVMASDRAGNIYLGNLGTSTVGTGDIEMIPAGSATSVVPTQLATSVSVGSFSSLAIDGNLNGWLSNSASTATTQYICTLGGGPSLNLPTSCSGTSTTAGGQTGSQSIAVDHNSNVWIGNFSSTAGTVSEIAATNTTTINGVSGSPFSGGGLLSPVRSLVDGLGNIWFTNNKSNAGSVSEFTSAGVAVSPSVGFTHGYAGAYGLAIDGSGNVWVGNSSSNATATPTVNGFFHEIVGAAAPVVTPLAAELPITGGTANTLGTRP